MILPRDEDLLDDLEAGLKYITVRHSTGTFYPSRRVAQRRLQSMFEQRLLLRFATGRLSEYIYHLPNRKPSGQIRHLNACLDLWHMLKSSGRLSWWVTERDYSHHIGGSDRVIRPDAVFALIDSDNYETVYAYEYEPSRTPADVARAKVPLYEQWLRSGAWQDDPGAFPSVFVHIPRVDRVEAVKEAIETRRSKTERWIINAKADCLIANPRRTESINGSSIRWSHR